jgi:hypothetical protein
MAPRGRVRVALGGLRPLAKRDGGWPAAAAVTRTACR